MRSRLLALALAAGLSGCLQPVEETPSSAIVTIDPDNDVVSFVHVQAQDRFVTTIKIRNTSARTIYVDAAYRRVEKLMDQKWKPAMETTVAPFASALIVGPARETRVSVVVAYDPGKPDQSPLLTDLRGLYRVRFRLANDSRGSDPLPVDVGISTPFAVVKSSH